MIIYSSLTEVDLQASFLTTAFIVLVAACAIVPIASRYKMGSVLGYLGAGILIGPFGLSLVTAPEDLLHLAEFGVIMMLFLIGLEIEPARLWRMRQTIFGLGGLQVALTALALMGIGILWGYSWRTSLVAGLALSLSSTALVLQILQEKKLIQTVIGEKSLAVLLFQDIAVIPILIFMPLLTIPDSSIQVIQNANFWEHKSGWVQTLAIGASVILVISLGRFLSRHLFSMIAKSDLREIFTALSLALIVGITLLMNFVGVSPALGAFVAGVALANSEYRRTIQTDIEPFKALLLGLFFISVGIGIDFELISEFPMVVFGLLTCLICTKTVILATLGRMFRLNHIHTLGFAFTLSQSGEFAFVLFQYASQLHIIPQMENRLLILTVALSMACTPLVLVFYNRFLVPRFLSIIPEKPENEPFKQNLIIMAGFGRFGQVTCRFLTAQGYAVTVLEKDPDQIEMLRRFGIKGYFGDAKRMEVLRNAGAASAQMLILAVNDIGESLEIVESIKTTFPHLTIYARARNRRHAYELHKRGVDYFRRDTFDSAITLSKAALVSLGEDSDSVEINAKAFEAHDEASLYDSFAFMENEPALIDFSKNKRQELEQLLQKEKSLKPRLDDNPK
jgi:glutathione-regulated potassium-efflux system ancillary protein KefC